MTYINNKLFFLRLFILTLYIITNINLIFSQDAPQSTIIGNEVLQPGDGYKAPAGPPINPDAQLYLPETFAPTQVFPPSRDRESILDQTNITELPTSIFRAGFTFAAQYGQYDKLPYSDIFLSPYMNIGPLFVMYDVPLRFDWNGSFITRMWTSSAAILSKLEIDLYYSKTNHTFKNIQISVYNGEVLYQGHGRFFYDYNPNLYAPYEPFKTFKFNLDVSYFGINYILANIAQPDLMSVEIYIKPLNNINNNKLETYREMKFYAIYGTDLDPFQGPSQGLYSFSPNPNSPTFSMFEIGADIPLYTTKNKKFSIEIFGDYTQFIGNEKAGFVITNGSGTSGGISLTFIEKIPMKFEISHAFGYWQPRWVNVFYYLDRPYINEADIIRKNKYMTLSPNLTYFTSSIGYEWVEKAVFFNLELYGDFSKQDLWISFYFTLGNVILKQLSLSFQWTIRHLYSINIDTIFDPEYSVLDINLKYHMLPNMYWGLLVKLNGEIGTIVDKNNISTIGTKPFIFLGIDFSFRY